MDIYYNGGEMHIYTYTGSETSEYEEPFNETEDTKTSQEPPQESKIDTIDSLRDQIIRGYQAVNELHYRNDGYISKTYDPDFIRKRVLNNLKGQLSSR